MTEFTTSPDATHIAYEQCVNLTPPPPGRLPRAGGAGGGSPV